MELVEASSRCGEHDLAAEAFQRLRQRTQNGGTDWALGVEARIRSTTTCARCSRSSTSIRAASCTGYWPTTWAERAAPRLVPNWRDQLA